MSTDARHAPVPPRPTTPPPAPAPDADGFASRSVNSPSGERTSGIPGRPRGESWDTDGGPASPAPPAHRTGGFRSLTPEGADPMAPPPPAASARFPDARPAPGEGTAASRTQPQAPAAVPRPPHPRPPHLPPRHTPPLPPRAEKPAETTTRLRRFPVAPPTETPAETTTRLRRVPAHQPRYAPAAPPAPPAPPAPAAPPAPPAPHPPGGRDGRSLPGRVAGRLRTRTAAAVACLVLGLGLIGGAVTGSWLTGGSGDHGTRDTFSAAAGLWHSVPVDSLFPPTVAGHGAGPGGADRTWTRVAVAPDSGCAGAFDPLLRKALAPVGCRRLLRATYTDDTQSYVTTVGLLFTEADVRGMTALRARFESGGLGRRTDLLPRPYAARGTAAAGFGEAQRASWTVSVLTDAPVVVYAVSGWADGRTVGTPEPAADAVRAGGTSAVAQAGLGFEAQGLADRVGRALRARVATDRGKTS